MSRFRSTKRAKELKRKAKKTAKEERKRDRRKTGPRATDDDIDWSGAVGFPSSAEAEPHGEPDRGSED